MLQITGMLYNLILWLYNWLCSWLYICCFNINVSYVHSSLGSLVVYLMLYTIFVLSYFCCMLEAVRRVSMGDNNKLLTTWQAASGTEFLNSSESTTVALQGTVTGTANVPVLANQPDLEAGAALSAWNRAAQCMPVPLPSADSLSLQGLLIPKSASGTFTLGLCHQSMRFKTCFVL